MNFTLSGKSAYAPAGPVMVPSSLGNFVLDVRGLSNATEISRKLSASANLKVMDQTSSFVMNPSAGGADLSIAGLTPGALRTAYDAGLASTGGNTVVAVVSAGSDLSQVISDLRQFELENQLPLVPIEIRQVEPVPSPQDTSGDGEWGSR